MDYSCFKLVKGSSNSYKALKNPLLIIDDLSLEMIMASPTTIKITISKSEGVTNIGIPERVAILSESEGACANDTSPLCSNPRT